MKILTQQDIINKLNSELFHRLTETADALGIECYLVGGYVRDLMLERATNDIDVVVVGSGISMAEAVCKRLGRGAHLSVFRNFGTAQVKWHDQEVEFVGARKESYSHDSRKPIVEDGTLEDDQNRRDFTINAMALCINADRFGALVDNYNGLDDLKAGIIRTPLDPDITFSDDPLRILRAVRFATQLDFRIAPETLMAMACNAGRMTILAHERIKDELQKIMASPKPSIGFVLMMKTGVLPYVLPELEAMSGVETRHGRGHKDNFYHTLEVLDNVAARTSDIWTRWGALLHDIGKPVTKQWDAKNGWTFHNHNFVGSKMVPRIFRRLGLPLGEEMRKVQKLVELHMRPIALVEDEVTDSAVRRLANYAEEDLEDLMILARADITSKNLEKKQRVLDNFDIVDEKIRAVRALDLDRAFRPALDGFDIMAMFGLPQGREVGTLMKELTRVSKDCEIEPTRQAAIDFLLDLGTRMGLHGDPSLLPDPATKPKKKEKSDS